MSDVVLNNPGSIFCNPLAYADPQLWHDTARHIRETDPVHEVDEPGFPRFWAITTHADVMEIERMPDVFTNSPIPALGPEETLKDIADVPVKTLVQLDGDAHKANRNVVNDWFKPVNVKSLQGRVDDLATYYVDRMAAKSGSCEFVQDVALHFPLQVILAIMGLPEDDYSRMLKLTQELFGAEDADIGRMGEDEGAMDVLLDFVTYFTDLANDRRAKPTDDLASVIANATIDGEPLGDLEAMGMYVIIATAGHDTTSNAVSGGLVALLQQPDQWDILKANPELIDAAADEFIRWTSPVKHFMRNCQQEFTFRDKTFQPGDLLLLSFASANRDETVFPNADLIDVTRPNAANHLGFGFGRHFCLGAHLARMEVRAIFKELISRVDHIELAADPTWIQSYFVQGPKAVPITYSMR